MQAQEPLDIGEYMQAPDSGQILFLPFENTFYNAGSGSFNIYPNGTHFINGIKGNGVEFNGQNEWLRIEPSMQLYNDFTVTFWIVPYSMANEMGVFSVRDQCVDNYRGYSMAFVGFGSYQVDSLSYQVNQHLDCWGFSGGDRYKLTGSTIHTNQKTFVAVVVTRNSNENRTVRFFINCEESSTVMVMNMDTQDAFNNLINYITTIGAKSTVDGQIQTFNGIVDEFRIYDRALTNDECYAVFRNAATTSVQIKSFESCSGDSALTEIINPEPSVEYQLYNNTKQEWIGSPLTGSCDTLRLSTGKLLEPNDFSIYAKHTSSGLGIFLDTSFRAGTIAHYIYISDTIYRCHGDSILFNNYYIFSDTTVYDTISNAVLCDTIIELTARFISPPVVSLGPDTTICKGYSIILKTNNTGCSFLWCDNSTDSTLTVNESGDYWVEVRCDYCSNADTIHVESVGCGCYIIFPNTFSPNNDGVNDYFGPYHYSCNLTEFSMQIFNRWGQQIFESKDASIQWDGHYKGESCPPGAYAVLSKWKSDGASEWSHYQGVVVLLK